ncbi:MAG: hypothetical protein IKF16_09400, partial [Lachnospiraceae bacterium]|nr:hypothetical protein [Lachnospiraceae bacterium]
MVDEDRYLTADEKKDFAELEAAYLGVGGIPLPDAQHAFPSPESLRKDALETISGDTGQQEIYADGPDLAAVTDYAPEPDNISVTEDTAEPDDTA